MNSEDIFYDVGAKVGRYTCICGKICEQVVSFEPHPDNYSRLTENNRHNNVDSNSFQIALINKNQKVNIGSSEDNAGKGGVQISEDGYYSVEGFKGDNFIQKKNLEKPNIMKIDVEGAELEVLKGLSNTLENDKLRAIFIEVHPEKLIDFSGSKEELYDFLERKGFEIEEIQQRGDQRHIKASKN